ncbi:MAG: DUF4159 domain-containing protein [Hyphomicrobiaceae bacterium]|nr:DUF4159 domain-containing protein [Hyphomicrobiaceae bacterium]
MIQLGFASPLVLGALILLPAIWWLLRLTPPKPREEMFPPLRILRRIIRQDETPAHSPWWLTTLRLALAAAIILAMAGPVLRPDFTAATATGPIYLIVDNGWSAAPDWDQRRAVAERIIARAADTARPITILATADGLAQSFDPGSPDEARRRLAAMAARAYPSTRATLIAPLRRAFETNAPGEIIFINDRLAHDDGADFVAFLATIQAAALTLYQGDGPLPLGLKATQNSADALGVVVTRADGDSHAGAQLRALDQRGRIIGEASATFARGEAEAVAKFVLPVELRNDIARIEIDGAGSAGGVRLVDERYRRRVVGLLSGSTADQDQPLLSPLNYIAKALQPFADIREPRSPDVVRGVPELINANVSVIMSADIGTFDRETERLLRDFLGRGGVVVRFAGKRLANAEDGGLLPVRIRQGSRTLGGTLSWQQPQGLGAFPALGPFAGMQAPGDVTVTRQVLAEPDGDLANRTWASLADGTPLVTGQRIGAGFLVLVHVTADTSWSNLPLSGSFVEMLRRLVAVSQSMGAGDAGGANGETVVLPPLRVLDGAGSAGPPGPEVRPLEQQTARSTPAGREHPAGLYGSEDAFVAINTLGPTDVIARLDVSSLTRARIQPLSIAAPASLKPHLLTATLLLLILDILAVLWLGGRLRIARAAAAIVLTIAAGLAAVPSPASAQSPEPGQFDRSAAGSNSLAYVRTGDAQVDEISRRGLAGLTRILSDRTALEPGEPIGIDIARDELAFFPLLYWPVTQAQPKPSPAAMARIDAFMKNGGTVLFDTRDQLTSAPSGFGRSSPANAKLREILATLDVPALEPAPVDHVVSRAFYLLEEFPGRYAGGQLWVEALPPTPADEGRPVRAGDGVSPILITTNDLAAAWAINDRGDYLLPTVPPDARQREMAYRVGVNIVMYAYTGNYKADQVHVPALLERIGQ